MIEPPVPRILRCFISAAAVLALVAGLALPAARAAAPAPADQLMSSDTYLLLAVRDVTRFKEKWQQTQSGSMLADPALQPFLEDIKASMSNLFSGMEDEIGLPVSELFQVPQGQLAIAFTNTTNDQLAVVALVEYGDNQEKVDQLLERATKSIEEDGGKRTEEDYLDTPLVIYDMSAVEMDAEVDTNGDAAADDEDVELKLGAEAETGPQQFAYFLKDQVLVAATDVQALKDVLDRWGGDADETLTDNAVYSKIMERTTGSDEQPVVGWYADLVGLVSSGAAAEQNPAVAMFAPMLGQFGLDKLQGIGGTYDMVAGEFDSISKTYIAIESPPQGLLQLFTFTAGDLQPEPWVPSDVASYMTLTWDVDAAWQAIVDLANSAQPGQLDQVLRQMAEDPNGPGIDLVQDVIKPLSGRVSIVADYQEPISTESQRVLVAFGLDDPKPVSATLDKLMQRSNGMAEKREFEGQVIYEFDMPAMAAPGIGAADAAEPVKMGVAVAHDCLMVATNVQILERVLRPSGDQELLGQSPDYRLVARRFPENSACVSFARPEHEMRAMYESIRSGEFQGQMAAMTILFPQLGEVMTSIDGSKLPEFEVVRRYLSPGGSYLETDESSLYYVGFSLRKEAP